MVIPGGGSPTLIPSPPPGPSFGLGAQSTNLANKDKMNQSGMTWVKIQHKWKPGDDPVSPTTYVNSLLAPSYNAIKAANANVMVISGAYGS